MWQRVGEFKTGEVGEPSFIGTFLQTDCHTVDTVLPAITGGKWYDKELGSLRLVRLVNHPSLIPSYKLIVIQWTQYYQQVQEVSDMTGSWVWVFVQRMLTKMPPMASAYPFPLVDIKSFVI